MNSPLYHIQRQEGIAADNAALTLIIQLDTNALFYVLMEDDNLVELKYFRLETEDQNSYLLELETVLDEGLGNTLGLRKLVIILNWPDSSLVPNKFYSPDTNREIIELMHGDLQKGTILSEEVHEWCLHNVYRIPSELHDLIQQRFPTAPIWHFNTPWLQSCVGVEACLRMIVLPGQILILLIEEGKLLISQRFPYETDHDIYFYLLDLMEKLKLEKVNTKLEVSGFILTDSSLLANLKAWFPLMTLSASRHPTGQFPAHFFSPLLNLAKCVS